MAENSAYIWIKGEDITLTFKDGDGTEGSVDLKFFGDYGLCTFDILVFKLLMICSSALSKAP